MDTTSNDARVWATLCHLSGLLGYLGIPFANLLGPMVVWLIKRNEHAFVDDQGKEALNFQLSFLIWFVLAFALCFLLVGFILLPVVAVLHVVFTVIAAVKSNDGVVYRYPMTLRLIR